MQDQQREATFLQQRLAGILLHPTSLPGPEKMGTLGPDAYRFIDLLAQCGFSVWQMLPLGPTHDDLSPYQCLSVHAGNPYLISLQQLMQDGWLEPKAFPSDTDYWSFHCACLDEARRRFQQGAAAQDRAAYDDFVGKHAFWLDDYALYQALRQRFGQRHWLGWPKEWQDKRTIAASMWDQPLRDAVDEVRFEQFVFFRQWMNLKRYAHSKNVLLFGDLPIFVAHDSAEVWARKDQFKLNAQGEMVVVAGVPPDYFSATGQLWGNPHYNWDHMREDGFKWWCKRVETQLELFDMIRIDHFRGFEASWEVPADAKTAINGQWVKAPGDELFTALRKTFGRLPVVAEDLGLITPEVEALRIKHGFPGMKILQFAFDSDAKNPYLPHNHKVEFVVYTGTHDNNTTVGWWAGATADLKQRVAEYLGYPQEQMPWPMIRAAFASVTRMAIVPMQDILELGAEHRMNTPGTITGNWQWRYRWEQVHLDLPAKVSRMIDIYGRKVEHAEEALVGGGA